MNVVKVYMQPHYTSLVFYFPLKDAWTADFQLRAAFWQQSSFMSHVRAVESLTRDSVSRSLVRVVEEMALAMEIVRDVVLSTSAILRQ